VNGFSRTYEGFDPGAEGLREALTSTGNGYLCTRGTAEWEDADGVHYPGTYGYGVYNRETTILGGLPVLNEDLVNLPNWLVVKLRIEGEEPIRLADVERHGGELALLISGIRHPGPGSERRATPASGRTGLSAPLPEPGSPGPSEPASGSAVWPGHALPRAG
jgi:hypothetical protein